MKYYCPVCAFNGMPKPPANYNICPCCGTEFGYDDVGNSWSELRDRWLSRGAPWFSRHTAPPPNWDPVMQLIGYFEQRVHADNMEENLPVQQFEPAARVDKAA